MTAKLRLGVIGVGHFGTFHTRVYSELDDVALVGVTDADASRAAEIAAKYGTRAFGSVDALLAEVDAVSVAVPTRHHCEVAVQALSRGVSVLVEKPMATTVAEARAMRDAAVASGAVLQVGHIMRFNPAVTAVREMNIEPRFIEVHRLSPFSFRSLDVGVVLDMMIHDIDLLLGLVRGNIEKVDAVAVSIVGETEDICNARISFDNGTVANLTASRAALKTMRKVRLFSTESYISLDFVANEGLVIRMSPAWHDGTFDVRRVREMSLDEIKAIMTDDLFTLKELKFDDREPLKAELQSFVDCVRTGAEPLVSAADGIRSMEAAEMILKAVSESHWYRKEDAMQS